MAGTYDPMPVPGAYTVPDGRTWMAWLRDAVRSVDDRLLAGALVSDRFGRPDGPLGLADTGQAWQLAGAGGAAALVSGELVTTGATTVVVDAGTGNVDVRLAVRHTGGAPGIVFRSDTAGLARLAVQLDAVNGLRFQKSADNGAGTAVSTVLEDVPMAFTTDGSRTYRLRVLAVDDLVFAWVDGRLVLGRQLADVDQAAYGTLTRVGVRSTTSGGAFDRLVVGEGIAPPGDVAPVRVVTGSYTLVRGDTAVEVDAAAATTITVPAGLPSGTWITLIQYGAGAVTVAGGAGLTLRNAGPLGGQYIGRLLRVRSGTEAVLL